MNHGILSFAKVLYTFCKSFTRGNGKNRSPYLQLSLLLERHFDTKFSRTASCPIAWMHLNCSLTQNWFFFRLLLLLLSLAALNSLKADYFKGNLISFSVYFYSITLPFSKVKWQQRKPLVLLKDLEWWSMELQLLLVHCCVLNRNKFVEMEIESYDE